MPDIKQVSISVGRKLSKNYQSWEIALSLVADLKEGETIEQVTPQLYSQAEDMITNEWNAWSSKPQI